MSQSILIETVRVVRDFLNAELAKYESWEKFSSNESIIAKLDVNSEPAFRNIKGRGVGQTTILKFLGGGWKQWKIQSALDTLNAEDINMNAITTFQTTGMAEGFKKAIAKDFNTISVENLKNHKIRTFSNPQKQPARGGEIPLTKAL